MSSALAARLTEQEFLSLPETLLKTELLDGEVIVAPSPSLWHQEILSRLVMRLREWTELSAQAFQVCQAPIDVRFGPSRILQPDAFVLDRRVPLDHAGPIDVVPLLCVEVLSQDRVYDRVTKRFVYGAAGVKEYWVVSPARVIERWSGAGLDAYQQVSQVLTSDNLPGFDLPLEQLFAQ